MSDECDELKEIVAAAKRLVEALLTSPTLFEDYELEAIENLRSLLPEDDNEIQSADGT